MGLFGHRKKLLREGAQAQAIVKEQEGANLTHNGFSAVKLVLEVHFEDGSQAEVSDKVDKEDLGYRLIKVGDILPVRYDPENRSKALVDIAAVRAQAEESRGQMDQDALARARRELDG
jgi:hypothetical protein